MGKVSRNGLLLAIVLFAVACSGGPADEGGAAATVKSFYEHLDSGRYDKAIALYDAETKRQLVPDEGAMDGFRGWAETEIRDGITFNVVNETELDGAVTIEFELSFSDGQTLQRKVTLIEEDGAWRMGVIG